MKLSKVKEVLNTISTVNFELQNGKLIPNHFHVTEVGIISKHFIDCGGVVRTEKVANFQLWEAADFDHRLSPQKLANIIALSEKTLGMDDLEIEVEYQSETIGKYDLDFNGKNFVLLSKKTNCLAQDKCGIPADKLVKPRYKISDIQAGTCTPGGGCC
jgi:hypothetical protein